ncbi:unnamed protein product [Musa banksii]
MEGISFVWSTWNWKVIPGKGCCNRGRINVFQMKLILFVANVEKAMKLKLLEESRQNFLVQMQVTLHNISCISDLCLVCQGYEANQCFICMIN